MAISISQLDPLASFDGTELIEVSQLSGTAVISATTISADAATSTILDAGNGFLVAGLSSGDRVQIAGFTNTANNFFSVYLSSVTAGSAVLSIPGGGSLVNEGIGATVVIAKWTSKRSYLADAMSGSVSLGLFLPTAHYPGVPGNAAVLLYVPVVVATTFPADFAGSVAKALVAATASTVITIKKSGVEVDTITFDAAGTTGTFASTGGLPIAFVPGDVLELHNQATADATLADIGTALYGIR